MLVSHLNTYLDGGAATAARRLHTALLKQGVSSRFRYSDNLNVEAANLVSGDASYAALQWTGTRAQRGMIGRLRASRFRKRFRRAIRNRPDGFEIFTSPVTKTPTVLESALRPSQADGLPSVIHLHWVSRWIDYESFFATLPADQPVVWTLHDMNAFTGGCHFSNGCAGHVTGCSSCPQLPPQASSSLATEVVQRKVAALSGVNLHVAAPSRWLIDQAKSSLVFQSARSFHHIPYGIDVSAYYPVEQETARRELGVPENAFLICFGAQSTENRRKGGQELVAALRKLHQQVEVQVMVFGDGSLMDAEGLPPAIKLGTIQGDEKKRLVYSAADVFALPSLDDNLPLTGMESMACGTPVVGFNAGGIPDYVRPGQSGLIAETGDANSLADCLLQLVRTPRLATSLRTTTRLMMQREYRDDVEANAYQNLYTKINASATQAPNRHAA
ncbi:glycosyltransferase [Crateriforma spongiae]|uniref:glycosyltransferase n=1 Tax=Crateriforma spongiae TaxID=2724528 RepID=UPI0039AF6B45